VDHKAPGRLYIRQAARQAVRQVMMQVVKQAVRQAIRHREMQAVRAHAR
jgi:hypothetical protein